MKEQDWVWDVAIHEAGHAFIWNYYGFEIDQVKVWGRGFHCQGFVSLVDEKEQPTSKLETKRWAEWLTGLYGGEMAGVMAVDKYDLSLTATEARSGCEPDRKNFKKYRPLGDTTKGIAQRLSMRILDANWKKVDTLARKILHKNGYHEESLRF